MQSLLSQFILFILLCLISSQATLSQDLPADTSHLSFKLDTVQIVSETICINGFREGASLSSVVGQRTGCFRESIPTSSGSSAVSNPEQMPPGRREFERGTNVSYQIGSSSSPFDWKPLWRMPRKKY